MPVSHVGLPFNSDPRHITEFSANAGLLFSKLHLTVEPTLHSVRLLSEGEYFTLSSRG